MGPVAMDDDGNILQSKFEGPPPTFPVSTVSIAGYFRPSSRCRGNPALRAHEHRGNLSLAQAFSCLLCCSPGKYCLRQLRVTLSIVPEYATIGATLSLLSVHLCQTGPDAY